jgi:hypothetical protein
MTPTAVGRDRGYQDPPGLDGDEDAVDFDDPLERAAMVLQRMTFATPEEAASLIGGEHGRRELAYTWARLEPATRRLYRLRADVALGAYRGEQR